MNSFLHETKSQLELIRRRSRAAATSKMERFNGWKTLTIMTKRFILDVAAVLDPPLTSYNW